MLYCVVEPKSLFLSIPIAIYIYIYIFLRSEHDWMSDAAAKLVIFIQDNMSLNKNWHNREHVSDGLLCIDRFFLLVHQDYHRFHYNVCSSTD